MAVTKTFNGTSYSIPTLAGENGWTNLTTFLQALADYAAVSSIQKQTIRVATTSPVTVSATSDFCIVVDRSVAGATTVTLPSGVPGQMFCIIDGKGDAATNNITISPTSATINGAGSKVISTNKVAVVLQYSAIGADWKIISDTAVSIAAVIGPASATDNSIATFDWTSGKLLRNTNALVSASDSSISTTAFTASGGTAANYTMYVTSSQLRLRGGTSGLAFYSTAGVSNMESTDAGAWTIGDTAKIGSSTYAGQLLVGRTNATNIASGYVGQILESTYMFDTNLNATTVWGNQASVTLTPGVWLLYGAVLAKIGTGVAILSVECDVSSTNGGTNGSPNNFVSAPPPTANYNTPMTIAGVYANVSANTTYYLNVRATYTSGNPKSTGRLRAVRIA